jgi:hypothetical protein
MGLRPSAVEACVGAADHFEDDVVDGGGGTGAEGWVVYVTRVPMLVASKGQRFAPPRGTDHVVAQSG